MARKPGKSKRPQKADIKAATERAISRSKGTPVTKPKVALHPEIKPAAVIKAESHKPKRARGRPTKYTPAVGKAICKMLAMGLSAKAIGKREWMPKTPTILSWGNDPSHPFSDHYVKARMIGFLCRAEEILDISDDGANDYMMRMGKEGEAPGWVVNGEAIARSRLRVETRKWVLAKMLPKLYGDRIAHEHDHSGAIKHEHAEVPQSTGKDHLADISKRYAKGKLLVIEGGGSQKR